MRHSPTEYPSPRPEALLAAIVSGSDDAIISKSLDGIILSWNDGAERIFGYTAEEAVGHSIELIIPGHLRHEEQDILARLRRGEKIDHFETLRVGKTGREVFVSLTVSPVRDDAGNIVGASKIARDVTERRRIEAALEDENRRKDLVLAMLSHELRGPLFAIRTAGELVKLEAQRVPSLERPAQVVERQASHMAKLLDGLLDLSRISRGKMKVVRAPMDVLPVVRHVVADHEAVARDAGVELRLTTPPEPVGVDGDPDRLTQILTNLLSNALKFTPAGGRVDVVAWLDGEDVVVEVADTGAGFSPETAEALFEAFHQGPQDLARTTGGLGLGLALARKLMDYHDGTLQGRSEGVGKGAQFTLRLPRIPLTDDAGESTGPGD